MADKSWRLGETQSIVYRLYDYLRERLNRRLTGKLLDGVDGGPIYVAEVGSGPATASSLIREQDRVALSVAVDIDHEALVLAKVRDPDLPVVVADMLHLPFATESFELVWNSSTLEHLEDNQMALKEMCRITKKKHYVFVGVPFKLGPLGFQQWMAESPVGIWIGTVFNRRELTDLFVNTGLTPQANWTYFFRFFIGMLGRKDTPHEE